VANPNSIFMLGGAPEAHEVLSKTPRIDLLLPPKTVPEAFPIKASDKQETKTAHPSDKCNVTGNVIRPILSLTPAISSSFVTDAI
jgi:hypothetical protein